MLSPQTDRYARCACNDGSFKVSRHPEERVARRRDPVIAPRAPSVECCTCNTCMTCDDVGSIKCQTCVLQAPGSLRNYDSLDDEKHNHYRGRYPYEQNP